MAVSLRSLLKAPSGIATIMGMCVLISRLVRSIIEYRGVHEWSLPERRSVPSGNGSHTW